MDLWQLHIFCKVVELKSFSRAAHEIHLSQPTVSSHIRDLEDQLGSRLIDRLSKESIPTAAGKLLYTYAVRLLSLRDEAVAALDQFRGQIRGNLTVGGSTIPGGYLLPKVISEFSRKYPQVCVSLIIRDTGEILKDILAGKIDLGVVGAQTEHQQLTQEVVMEDRMCLVVPAKHPWANRKSIPLKDLYEQPFVVRERGSGTLRTLELQLAKAGVGLENFKVVGQMGSTLAVVQSIKHGMGISILSPIAVAEESRARAVSCLAVEGIDLKRNFYLTRHRSRSASPLGKAFSDFLLASPPQP